MPALKAENHQAQAVARALQDKGLAHLRTRTYGSLIIIESGPPDAPDPRARLRRATVHLWILEMATHTGRWEKTPFRSTLLELLELLIDTFGWTLAPIDENPGRTTESKN
jgi:hypothetical protein